jgi:hypothetical protein
VRLGDGAAGGGLDDALLLGERGAERPPDDVVDRAEADCAGEMDQLPRTRSEDSAASFRLSTVSSPDDGGAGLAQLSAGVDGALDVGVGDVPENSADQKEICGSQVLVLVDE